MQLRQWYFYSEKFETVGSYNIFFWEKQIFSERYKDYIINTHAEISVWPRSGNSVRTTHGYS